MTEQHEKKLVQYFEILRDAAQRDFEYWDTGEHEATQADIKRFRACALREWHAYEKILECMYSQEKTDSYLKIWLEE